MEHYLNNVIVKELKNVKLALLDLKKPGKVRKWKSGNFENGCYSENTKAIYG